jgi:polysaccharide pyruvyl transferase CsaB
MATPERVLLSAFIGSDNLGDEAIFLALVDQLETRLKKSSLTVISMNREKTRRLLLGYKSEWHAGVGVRSRRFLPLAILRHDVCIFGGGGIIQDQSSILNVIYFLAQIQFAKLSGKIVALAFVGIGPLNSRVGRACARVALSKIALCVVRDQDSKRALDRLGVIGTDIICSSDIVLSLKCQSSSGKSDAVDGKYVLLSLRHWYGQSSGVTPAALKNRKIKSGTRLDILLTRLAQELVRFLEGNKDFHVVAVPCFGQRDALVHTALRNKLNQRYQERFRLHGSVSDPCHYLRLAASARCVIGMRLHSLILASLRAVPIVALSYSPKVSAFMEQLGLGDQVIDIASEPELEGFASRLETALGDSGHMSSTIERRTRVLKKANEAALAELAKVIEGE